MKAIWKFELPKIGIQLLDMPEGAEILSVGEQYERLCIWAMVDPAKKEQQQPREIEVVGTGFPIAHSSEVNSKFLGTVVMYPFVWHIFEHQRDEKVNTPS